MSRFPPVAEFDNPIAGKDVAETFGESDVTIREQNVEPESKHLALTNGKGLFPDDFEDGDITGWGGDTANLTASSSDAIQGVYSGVYTKSNAANTVTSPSIGSSTENVGMKINIPTDVGDTGDQVAIYIYDSGGTRLGILKFLDGSNDIHWHNGVDKVVEQNYWAPGTTYELEIVLDFANNDAEIHINGNRLATYSLENAASSWDYIDIQNDTNTSGATRSFIFDNWPIATSGSAWVEWPSPTNIYRWDAATFQNSTDSETVDVYIEENDGSGWTEIAGPISRGQEITADPANECRFRVDISRASTANNPTLDAIYRRWVL